MSFTYTNQIDKIRFHILSTDEIIEDSYVNVTSYDLFRDNKPKPKGVYDGHLGTTDHNYKCETCFNDKKECPGHDGHILLNYPVISPICLTELRKWLKLICFECGEPIIEEKVYSKFPKSKRLGEASKSAKASKRKCPKCETIHPTINKDKVSQLIIYADMMIEDKRERKKLYPHIIQKILERISDETVIKLGKPVQSHPRYFILNALKVPPVSIRPDVKKVGGGRSTNDDLTTLLQCIVKKNDSIPTVIPDEIDPKLDKTIYELGGAFYDFVKGGHGKKIITSGGNPLTSLSLRLRGKQGRFRKNQMGKRVRGCARSTINCDVTLKIDEVGIPLKFARMLQVSETVQESNRTRLMIYFNNGRKNYPGCTSIIKKKTGTEHNIEKIKKDFELEIGDIINRDLITGDVVLYNRQPSLMPSNITCHKIIVSEDPNILTLRMNVLACKFYGADFDGDQMNIFTCTSVAERNELAQVGANANYFMSFAKSIPLTGEVGDSVVGSFELTRRNVKLDKYHAMLLFANCSYLPNFDEKKEYTGWDIISKMLTETPINYEREPNYYIRDYAPYINYNRDEILTVIEKGIMKRGILDKKAIGSGSMGGIFHIIHNEYGPNKAMEVIYNLQQIALGYMYFSGFTVGIMDLILNQSAMDKIHEIESSIINESRLITEKLNNGELIPPIGKTASQYYEEQQIAILRIMDDFMEPILNSIDKDANNMFKLVMSGSKGQIGHIYHMVSAVGQLLINGERTREKLSFKRTMPYYRRFETTPESRGYITDSYITGISMPAFAASAMAARFDLISKALSTSVTGEQNRKSIKNLETIIIDNMRLCMKGNNIIQFNYGDDNLDARFVEKVKFPTVMISDKELREKYRYDSTEQIFTDEFNQILDDRNEYRRIYLNIESLNLTRLMEDSRFMPFNLPRIIQNVKNIEPKEKVASIDLIIEMMIMIKDFIAKLPYIMFNEEAYANKIKIPEFIKYTTFLSGMLIKSYLNSNNLKKMNKNMLTAIFDRVKTKYQTCLIEYGSAVGIIAAQSFSEPLTQYMLDAHHRTTAGGTSKSELTRTKEIMGVRPTERMEAPSMFLELIADDNIKYDKPKVKEIANNIELLTLKQFGIYWQIFYEKFGEPIHELYKGEKDMIKDFLKYNPLLQPPSDLLKWCIRIVLNKTTLILRNISLEYIVTKIRDTFPTVYCVYSPESAKQIILRIYIRNVEFKTIVDEIDIKNKASEILNILIRGVEGIINAEAKELIRNKIDEEGKIVRDKNRYGIITLGSNIYGVLKNKYIDPLKVQTDSIDELYNILGIEAARQKIVSELSMIGEANINYHHLSIYADEMTFTGRVTSIDRPGLSTREANNILLRLGFSSPIQTIEEAGINAMTDEIDGFTAKLLVGATPKVGTTYNSFHINSDIIRENIKTGDDYLDNL